MRYLLRALTTAGAAVASAAGGFGRVERASIGAPPPSAAEDTPPGPISHEWAIENMLARAQAFGEREPQLLESTLTTYSEARNRVDPSEGQKPESLPILPDAAPVWLVRASGTFVAPHAMVQIDEKTGQRIPQKPRVGWMYTIIDAQTGKTLQSGFRGQPAP